MIAHVIMFLALSFCCAFESSSITSDDSYESLSDTLDKILGDDYQYAGFLGDGTFAEIHLVKNISSKKKFAVKILSVSKAQSPKAVGMMQEEIRILKSVQSPFIIQIFDSNLDCDRPIFFMEYFGKGDLFDMLDSKDRLSERRSLRYTSELFLALEYLHSQNIVHCDIKPENILLDKADHIKLIDFGGSQRMEYRDRPKPSGTLEYLSPERLKYDTVAFSDDIWAAGVCLFYFVTGYLPFESSRGLDDETIQLITSITFQFPKKFKNILLQDFIVGIFQLAENRYSMCDIKSHSLFEDYF